MRKLLWIAILFIPLSASAYLRTMSDSGLPLFWPAATPALRLNPTTNSGLSDTQVTTFLHNSFSAWTHADANTGFSLQSNTNIPPVSGYDNSNTIYFTSNSNRKLGWGVIAVTEVLYYVSSGQIVEFDMAFNDDNYQFSEKEGDTGRPGNFGRTKIYLQDVATHEAGHAFGLDHSQVGRSAMVYTAFSGQFDLGNDDRTAIQTIYPGPGGGAIHGYVAGTQGGIFGMQVTAINAQSGKVQAATLAESNGQFRIGDLPDGDYFLLMEPFLPDTSSISSYWKNINHRFCGGSKIRRSFFSACGQAQLNILNISGGRSVSTGTLSPQCSQMGNPGGAPASSQSARSVSANGGAFYGTLQNGESHYYRLRAPAGSNLQARALSYSLYSPVDVRVEFLNAQGQSLAGSTSTDNAEQPMPGGYTNFDSVASANANGEDILVRVTAANARLSSSLYPAGFDLLDSGGHYAVSIQVNGQMPAHLPSDMSSCISVVNTPQSASISRAPAEESQINSGTGCGSIDTSSGNGPSTGGGALAIFLAALVFGSSQLARRFSRR